MNSQAQEILHPLMVLLVGGPLYAEIVGYLWHRGTEHNGWLGNAIRHRHWVHHKVDYPTQLLRRDDVIGYKSAGSWSWYLAIASAITLAFGVLPLRDAACLSVGGTLYGTFVLGALHQAFHTQDHWLKRFQWFQTLVRRHDIHHWAAGNYGIALFFMDRLFGTLREDLPPAPEPMFPGYASPKKSS